MKKVFFILFFISLISFGQTDRKNVFEASYLKAKYGMDSAFQEAVKKQVQ